MVVLKKIKNYQMKKMKEILKQETRILKPKVFQTLLEAVDNPKHRTLIQFMFHTGIRYETAKRFHKHSDWLMDNAIYLPKGSTLKHKARQREKHILLSYRGREVSKDFLQIKKLPSRQGFNKMLKKYCRLANITDIGFKPLDVQEDVRRVA